MLERARTCWGQSVTEGEDMLGTTCHRERGHARDKVSQRVRTCWGQSVREGEDMLGTKCHRERGHAWCEAGGAVAADLAPSDSSCSGP